MTPAEVVDAFIAALERKDLDAACEQVGDDLEYDNVPLGAVRGPDGLRQVLGPFLAGCDEIDWVVHHQAAEGPVVMNERLDRFRFGDRWMELRVAGLFVVRDGRIVLWRDYFDEAEFRRQLAGDPPP